MQTTQHPRTESRERRSPYSDLGKPRRFRFRTLFFVVFGLGLLAASVIGTGMVLQSHASNPRAVDAAPLSNNVAVGFGHVDVEERVASLSPQVQSGRVTEVLVGENQPVKKGAVLLRLDNRLAQAKVKEAEEDLLLAQKQEEAARDLPQQLEEDVNQQQEAVAGAADLVAEAKEQLAKAERLSKSKVAPVSKEDVAIARQKVRQAEAAERAAKAKLRQLKLRKPQRLIEQAQFKVAAKKAQLETARVALDDCELKAPSDGTILRLSVSVGDVLGGLQPHEPAIIFCPDGPRVIRAEIEQEEAPRVKVGMPAEIKDDSRLTGAWRGKVKSVSDWFSHRRSMLLEPRQFNDVRTLECIIELDRKQDPALPPLKIGQRVRVTLGK